MAFEQSWVKTARSYLGVREIKGSAHSSVILDWLTQLGAWWRDDETPWCGVFVGICMRQNGYRIPKLYMRAKAWLDWGVPVEPTVGAIAVKGRRGGGHVFFVLGITPDGEIIGLGGNQGNRVSVAVFRVSDVLGYRLPEGVRNRAELPVLTAADAEREVTEA